MKIWTEKLLQTVEHAESPQELFSRIAETATVLGFDRCAYGMYMPLPVTRPKVVIFNNYSSAWKCRYEEAGYLQIDPTVTHAKKTQLPLVWSDQVFQDTPEFWDEAQAEDLRVGWAKSSQDASFAVSMLTLARATEPLTTSELNTKELQMRWLVDIAHVAFTRLLTPKLSMLPSSPLTLRETEILKWSADGKTAGEISQILTISVDTVKFHTKNAVAKLGAANKTAAVARAAILGLLS